ncbi:MAG: hypothetical protein F6K35_43805 [Okeania sp. SIO2H7]|nr:hypothetical protein [Okeania sp. SIO2H7]
MGRSTGYCYGVRKLALWGLCGLDRCVAFSFSRAIAYTKQQDHYYEMYPSWCAWRSGHNAKTLSPKYYLS